MLLTWMFSSKMIRKKKTRIIFEDKDSRKEDELQVGIPLSKGEIVHVDDSGKIVDYEVADKTVNYILKDEVLEITYVLKRK